MTYCVGMKLRKGLVFMSDTRTNSGVDNVSVYRKSHTWSFPGDRVITILAAGNLATTQSVVSVLDERAKAPADRSPSIFEAPTMFRVAQIVGETLRDTIQTNADTGERADGTFNATLILGGQIAGMEPRLFLVYPEGNFVEAGDDTPFFQIGETKYGRPILVRAYDPDMSFEDAVKLLLVSFDSTLKANLSVGMPLDVQIHDVDALVPRPLVRIEERDPYYRAVSEGWSEALREAFSHLPDFSF